MILIDNNLLNILRYKRVVAKCKFCIKTLLLDNNTLSLRNLQIQRAVSSGSKVIFQEILNREAQTIL